MLGQGKVSGYPVCKLLQPGFCRCRAGRDSNGNSWCSAFITVLQCLLFSVREIETKNYVCKMTRKVQGFPSLLWVCVPIPTWHEVWGLFCALLCVEGVQAWSSSPAFRWGVRGTVSGSTLATCLAKCIKSCSWTQQAIYLDFILGFVEYTKKLQLEGTATP